MTIAKDLPRQPLKITDITLRDGHQSLLATRMRTEDMVPIAADLDKAGFWSVEVWGGATFDVTTRFLGEDPWERIHTLKKLMPKTPFQMLLRGQNLVGYRNYADDVVNAFVDYACETGIDVFRVFDALNDERNLETSFKAIKRKGKHVQGCVCYSVTERKLGGPVFNVEYFVNKAKVLHDMGADSICLKDMAGLLAPYDAYELVKAIKSEVKLPLHLHSHYTSGMASMTALKAIEAGLDILDCALAPLALRTSHPAVEPLTVTLQGTPRDTGLDLELLLKLGAYIESIAPKYRTFLDESKMAVIDALVLAHQVPGGMASNLAAQLKEAGAADKLEEVYKELPRTRKEMGYPPLVTPTSQIVGVQAVNNVIFGRYKMITAQVKDYAYGLYGKPPVPMDPELVKLALKGYPRGEQPITKRPGDILEPEMEKAKEATKGLAKNLGDVLIYALYPTTGLRFLRWKYGLEPLPDDVKPRTMEEVKKEQEVREEVFKKFKQGVLVEKQAVEVPLRGPRTRSFHVFVGSEYYKIDVDPADGGGAAPAPMASAPPAARPATPPPAPPPAPTPAATPKPTAVAEGEMPVRAPMPGIIIRYNVQEGQKVKAGDTVVILEAMKMENALPAPADGAVKKVTFKAGAKVAKGDVLAVIG
ncbi:MAG: pyruvate carboxylase subunit B [Chloroflexi bacterium]|nr:pyruvate carboxylase subunit B [Chloroflexota bacterium]